MCLTGVPMLQVQASRSGMLMSFAMPKQATLVPGGPTSFRGCMMVFVAM
jgi:hypothetical protein